MPEMPALFSQEFPYLGLALLLILGTIGLPFPEDAILISAGALVVHQVIEPLPTILVIYCTLLMTDLFLYSVGRKYGRRLVEHKTFRAKIFPDRLLKLERQFKTWGSWVVFFGRFVPGIRAQMFLVAGILRMSRVTFLLVDAAAALLTLLLWGGVGYIGATNIKMPRTPILNIDLFAFAALLATIAGWMALKHFRNKRRSPM